MYAVRFLSSAVSDSLRSVPSHGLLPKLGVSQPRCYIAAVTRSLVNLIALKLPFMAHSLPRVLLIPGGEDSLRAVLPDVGDVVVETVVHHGEHVLPRPSRDPLAVGVSRIGPAQESMLGNFIGYTALFQELERAWIQSDGTPVFLLALERSLFCRGLGD